VLGEFFFSDLDAIDEALLATGPDRGQPSVVANGLSPSTSPGSASSSAGDVSRHARPDGPGAPRVGERRVRDLRLPEPLVAALVGARDLTEIAERWSETDELRLSEWNSTATGAALTGLKTLAAARGTKPLWYWWSV
jgi:hypothetical protein